MSDEMVGWSNQRAGADDGLSRLSFDELLVIMNGRGLDATDCMGKKDMIRKIQNADSITESSGGAPKGSSTSLAKKSFSDSRGTTSVASPVASPVSTSRAAQSSSPRKSPIPRQTSWRASSVNRDE